MNDWSETSDSLMFTGFPVGDWAFSVSSRLYAVPILLERQFVSLCMGQ